MSREFDLMATYLDQLGFRPKRSGDHKIYEHPEHHDFVLACTPSDHRSFQNALTQLARCMGITRMELELKLGRRQPKHQGPKVRRTRNEEGRRARRFELVRNDEPEAPARIGTPKERMAAIARDRQEAEARQLRSEPGTPAYLCALDDIARCRREWLEAEQALKEAA